MNPPHSLDFLSTMGLAMGGFTDRDAPPRREAWALPRLELPHLWPRLGGLLGSMLPPGF
jgi:hypothetical protein